MLKDTLIFKAFTSWQNFLCFNGSY